MLFYCPNCRQNKEVVETSTQATKTGRIAHKTNCPVCNLELVEFIPHEKTTPVTDSDQPTN